MKTGLVSITFRNLSPAQIIDLVQRAGQDGIEWGGDVHVPHGDKDTAALVGEMTRDAGLEVLCYGSYYRLGEKNNDPFEDVLESAITLGAPTIRVWAGNVDSANASPEDRRRVMEDAVSCANLALDKGVRVAFEFHAGTLTDTTASAAALLEALPQENIDTLWQPYNGQPVPFCMESLHAVIERVSNIHCFHWVQKAGGIDIRPLAEGAEDWGAYLTQICKTGRSHAVLLEFVRNNDPDQYLEDAKTLHHWVAEHKAGHRGTENAD